MPRHKKGFSLIELMIVIVIIGVLASAAIPSYNAYLIRSRMSEGLGLLTSVKAKVIEYYTIDNVFPPLTTASDPIGLLNINSPFVTSVTLTNGGGNASSAVLTAVMNSQKLGLGPTPASMNIMLDIIAPGLTSAFNTLSTNPTSSFMTVCYAYCATSNQQYYPSSCILVASPPAS